LARDDGTNKLLQNVDTELPELQKSADLRYIAAEATQLYDKFSAKDCKTLEISWQLQSRDMFLSRFFAPKINFGFCYENYTGQGLPNNLYEHTFIWNYCRNTPF
jgi:hypothetical protein